MEAAGIPGQSMRSAGNCGVRTSNQWVTLSSNDTVREKICTASDRLTLTLTSVRSENLPSVSMRRELSQRRL